jgi:pyruvate/2-oxoglutarate dehydrogenase complex dihydrolipoamide acyltransferase (E2) component
VQRWIASTELSRFGDAHPAADNAPSPLQAEAAAPPAQAPASQSTAEAVNAGKVASLSAQEPLTHAASAGFLSPQSDAITSPFGAIQRTVQRTHPGSWPELASAPPGAAARGPSLWRRSASPSPAPEGPASGFLEGTCGSADSSGASNSMRSMDAHESFVQSLGSASALQRATGSLYMQHALAAIRSLRAAMQRSKHVLLVLLAGTAGACKSLLRSLVSLRSQCAFAIHYNVTCVVHMSTRQQHGHIAWQLVFRCVTVSHIVCARLLAV